MPRPHLTPEEYEQVHAPLLFEGPTETEPVGRQPILTNLADVQPSAVEFVWDPYLPLGKLTLLEGDPGSGKTWIALAITAALTTGKAIGPGAVTRNPAKVVYLTAEDDLSDTLRPRLDLLGANPSRINALEGWRSSLASKETQGGQVTLQDLDVLERVLKDVKPLLMIVDPLQGFFGKGDFHRANEVRPVLSGLGTLAERYRCAVLAIRHLSKAPTGRALHRGLGSIDFTAAARSVLLAGQAPNSEARALAHIKSSCAEAGQSQGYRLGDGFAWTGPVDLTAADLLAPETSSIASQSRVAEAEEFLLEFLAEPQPTAEVFSAAKAEGISKSALKRAKKKLGIDSDRRSKAGSRRGEGEWVWAFPAHTEGEPLDPLEEGQEEPGVGSRDQGGQGAGASPQSDPGA